MHERISSIVTVTLFIAVLCPRSIRSATFTTTETTPLHWHHSVTGVQNILDNESDLTPHEVEELRYRCSERERQTSEQEGKKAQAEADPDQDDFEELPHMEYERRKQTAEVMHGLATESMPYCYMEKVTKLAWTRKLYTARFKTRDYYMAVYGTANLLLVNNPWINSTVTPSAVAGNSDHQELDLITAGQRRSVAAELPLHEEISRCRPSTTGALSDYDCPEYIEVEMDTARYPHFATFRRIDHTLRTSIIPQGFALMDTNKDGLGSREEMLRYFGDRRRNRNRSTSDPDTDPAYREGDAYNIIPYGYNWSQTFAPELYGLYYDPDEQGEDEEEGWRGKWRGPYPHQNGDTFDIFDFMFIEPTIVDKLFYIGDAVGGANGLLQGVELVRVLRQVLEGRPTVDDGGKDGTVTGRDWSVLVDRKSLKAVHPEWLKRDYPIHILLPFAINTTIMSPLAAQRVFDTASITVDGTQQHITVDVDLDTPELDWLKEAIPDPTRVLKSVEHINETLVPYIRQFLKRQEAVVTDDTGKDKIDFQVSILDQGYLLAEFRRLWYYLLFHADMFDDIDSNNTGTTFPNNSNSSNSSGTFLTVTTVTEADGETTHDTYHFTINSTSLLECANEINRSKQTNNINSSSRSDIYIDFVSAFFLDRGDILEFPIEQAAVLPSVEMANTTSPNSLDVDENATAPTDNGDNGRMAESSTSTKDIVLGTLVAFAVVSLSAATVVGVWYYRTHYLRRKNQTGSTSVNNLKFNVFPIDGSKRTDALKVVSSNQGGTSGESSGGYVFTSAHRTALAVDTSNSKSGATKADAHRQIHVSQPSNNILNEPPLMPTTLSQTSFAIPTHRPPLHPGSQRRYPKS